MPGSQQLSLSCFPALVFSFNHFWHTLPQGLDVSGHPSYENQAWLLWITSLCLDLSLDGQRPSLCPSNVLSLAFPQLFPQKINCPVNLSCLQTALEALEALERATGAASGETGGRWNRGLSISIPIRAPLLLSHKIHLNLRLWSIE